MGNDVNIISFIEHKNLTVTAAAWSSVGSVQRWPNAIPRKATGQVKVLSLHFQGFARRLREFD